jgi:hypothetical protein
MIKTLLDFKLHNSIDAEFDNNEYVKAYSFGSSAHTYILENSDICIKQYDKILRWTTKNHDNIDDIFNKELEILQKQTNIKIYSFDNNRKIIKMQFLGHSLYNHFLLPQDWKLQIKQLFDNFTQNNIYYPEFRLQNILVNNEKISFVDFGLASYDKNKDNNTNCKIFIELLSLLEERFALCKSNIEIYILYDTFINNIKLYRIEKYLNNVF